MSEPDTDPPRLPGEIWRGRVTLPAGERLCAICLPDEHVRPTAYLAFSTKTPTIAQWYTDEWPRWGGVNDNDHSAVYAACLRSLLSVRARHEDLLRRFIHAWDWTGHDDVRDCVSDAKGWVGNVSEDFKPAFGEDT